MTFQRLLRDLHDFVLPFAEELLAGSCQHLFVRALDLHLQPSVTVQRLAERTTAALGHD